MDIDLSIIAQVSDTAASKAGKAIALGVGAGLGTIGPGIGVGSSSARSSSRSPGNRRCATRSPRSSGWASR